MLKIQRQASAWSVKELHYQLRMTDNSASAAKINKIFRRYMRVLHMLALFIHSQHINTLHLRYILKSA